MSTAAAILIKARALIADPKNWALGCDGDV